MTQLHFVVHTPDGKIRCSGRAHRSVIPLHASGDDGILLITEKEVYAVRAEPSSYLVRGGTLIRSGPDIEAARARKLSQLDAAFLRAFHRPFRSSALGSPHWYQASADDQMALVHAAVAGGPLRCSPAGESPSEIDHTAGQALQAHADYMHFRRERSRARAGIHAAILAAKDFAELDHISLNRLTTTEDTP